MTRLQQINARLEAAQRKADNRATAIYASYLVAVLALIYGVVLWHGL